MSRLVPGTRPAPAAPAGPPDPAVLPVPPDPPGAVAGGALSGPERAAWTSLRGLGRLLVEHVERDLLDHAGIPLTYFEILAVLAGRPGTPLRMGALADEAGWSRSRLAHAVARLEERGWVRRTRSRGDRRGVAVAVTRSGCAFVEQVRGRHDRAVRAVLVDALTPEQLDALGALAGAVAAHAGALQPRDR